MDTKTFDEQIADAVRISRDQPGIEHIWLNAFSCINPSDDFAADIGREVIRKVMSANPHHEDALGVRRQVVLRFNAS